MSLLDGKDTPAYGWRVARAIPVRLEAPSFAAAGGEVVIETLELMVSGISVVPR